MLFKALIVFEVLLLFNLMIAVHELGHFLAAKWRGLKIDRFAIWFGKPLWKKNIGGIEYALGWVPAGGYVALPQMATMEAIEGKTESSGQTLPPISSLDKTIVAFAGPLFSFLLAVGFAVVVWAVGKPVNASDNSTVLGWVAQLNDEHGPGPAWQAGLRPGDRIVEIDGHPVTHFYPPPMDDSVTWRVVTSGDAKIELKYVRNGQTNLATATPYKRPTSWWERKAVRQILVAPEADTIVDDVTTNGPAALAGLRPGDKIVKVDGEPIYSPLAVVTVEAQLTNGIRAVPLTVMRGTNELTFVVHPVKPVKPAGLPPALGFDLGQYALNAKVILDHPSPVDQIEDSAGQIFATIGALLHKNDVGLGQLAGPVMIVRLYGNFLESEEGWRKVLWFSVVLNVNLAMLNLLPFPVLDGGHITLAILEAIRRRPVSANILQYVQTVCAVVLIGFMLVIMFFDTGDWFRSARDERAESGVVFAPPQH
jgi:regulator of sigma E protease